MKKFEYRVEAFTEPFFDSLKKPFFSGLKKPADKALEYEVWINSFGVEGWELVQCVGGYYFFKREVTDK